MNTKDSAVVADSLRALARFLEGEDIRLSELIEVRPERLIRLASMIERTAPSSTEPGDTPGAWGAWPISIRHANGALTTALTPDSKMRGETLSCEMGDACPDCKEMVD